MSSIKTAAKDCLTNLKASRDPEAIKMAQILKFVDKGIDSFKSNRGSRALMSALLGAGLGAAGQAIIDPKDVDKYSLLYGALTGGSIGAGIGTYKDNKEVV